MSDVAPARRPIALIVVLTIALVAMLLFLAIARQLTHADLLQATDMRVLAYMRARATPAGDDMMSAVSLVGSPVAMAVLAASGAAWLGFRRQIVPLVAWCAAFAGASALTVGLKYLFRRARPEGAAAFLHGASFSFPSGHALGSTVGIGITAYLLMAFFESRRNARIATAFAAAILVLLIGWSRLYLGVHYLSDVVAGISAGGLWLCLCIAGSESVRHRTAARR